MRFISSPMAETKSKKTSLNLKTEEMAQAGLHFGHKSSKIHPKMKPYLYGVRNGVHIIDLEKTAEKLKEALNFMKEAVADGKIILIVGTKIQAKALVKQTAEECGLPYITERWLGGTLTNFETIKKRIDYFKDLERKKKEGELENYTKKERIKFDEELKNLEIKFGGIKILDKVPDIVFVLDMQKDDLAIKEAKAKDVKVVALADTNVDPTLADYPIPANDDAMLSVKYILEKVKEVIKIAQSKVKKEK